MHLVIHFYLVKEAEMVIVFIDGDSEQNHAFAVKIFQEANKEKERKEMPWRKP